MLHLVEHISTCLWLYVFINLKRTFRQLCTAWSIWDTWSDTSEPSHVFIYIGSGLSARWKHTLVFQHSLQYKLQHKGTSTSFSQQIPMESTILMYYMEVKYQVPVERALILFFVESRVGRSNNIWREKIRYCAYFRTLTYYKELWTGDRRTVLRKDQLYTSQYLNQRVK